MPSKLSVVLARRLSTRNMDQSTLVLTQIIFRHGHRSPDEKIKYPGDPYANEAYLPFGKGELTQIGREQCFALGQSLRKRYRNHLGAEYFNGIVDAKSSEVPRARTTLQLVLAGLFPPTPQTQVNADLNWQPVPFTYTPFKDDALIGRAIANLHRHECHPDFRRTMNSQQVIQCIEKELKWDVKVQAQCLLLYDTVKSQIDMGLETPKWCAEIFPAKLKQEVEEFVRHNYSRRKFLVDGHGDMIKEINAVMEQKENELKIGKSGRNNEVMPKIYLYSGHDINIIGLLTILKQFDASKWPNYTSNIAFELHKVGDEFYVRIVYQDGPSDARNFREEQKIELLNLPNIKTDHGDSCTLREFTEYVKEYFPEPEAPKL